MISARDYVRAYRRDEPGVVEMNPGLQDLQDEAERALGIVMEAKQTSVDLEVDTLWANFSLRSRSKLGGSRNGSSW